MNHNAQIMINYAYSRVQSPACSSTRTPARAFTRPLECPLTYLLARPLVHSYVHSCTHSPTRTPTRTLTRPSVRPLVRPLVRLLVHSHLQSYAYSSTRTSATRAPTRTLSTIFSLRVVNSASVCFPVHTEERNSRYRKSFGSHTHTQSTIRPNVTYLSSVHASLQYIETGSHIAAENCGHCGGRPDAFALLYFSCFGFGMRVATTHSCMRYMRGLLYLPLPVWAPDPCGGPFL